METYTVRQVSLNFGISVRMLRYYEQVELLESGRVDDYAYRVYDSVALKRLQQIVILRKLQIPIKQIREILNNQDAVEEIEIFKRNMDC
jgi:DNA-binding transcriptional MerR regulator